MGVSSGGCVQDPQAARGIESRVRALIFVRYHSGDGAGHVGWGFELPDGRVDVGSVENHSGHILTPAREMGFWNEFARDPIPIIREHGYDDLRVFEVPNADAVSAYRVVLWIKNSAYQAIARNCEDDAYDVLRAYGVPHLEAPFFNWFPRWWFSRMHSPRYHLASYRWEPRRHEEYFDLSERGTVPLRPVWRRPWHPQFQMLIGRKWLRLPRLGNRKRSAAARTAPKE
jgi:hypothetical protein